MSSIRKAAQSAAGIAATVQGTINQTISFDLQIPGVRKPKMYSFRGSSSLGVPYRFDVNFTTNRTIDLEGLLGKPAMLTIRAGFLPGIGGVPLVVSGIINRAATGGFRHDRYMGLISIVPVLWEKERTKRYRIFEKRRADEIVSEVMGIHGKPFIGNPLALPIRDYCVQYGESDLGFCRRILQEEGYFFNFNKATGFSVIMNDEGLNIHLPLSGDATFEQEAALVPGGVQRQTYDWQKPGADLRATEGVDPENYTNFGVEVGRMDGLRSKVVEKRAKQDRAAFEQKRVSYNGESHSSDIQEGIIYGSPQGSFLVTECEYAGYDPTMLPKRGRDGDRGYYRCTFKAQESQTPFIPPLLEKPRALGPEVGIVVSETGSEEASDKHGRVRVRLPWDEESKKGTVHLRVAVPWSGSGYGMLFQPRAGHEVLVNFLEDNIDAPIITGTFYNGDNLRPYNNQGDAARVGIKTQTTPLSRTKVSYNELSFNDKQGSEEVRLRGERDIQRTVLNDRDTNIRGNRTVVVEGDSSETVGRGMKETIGGDSEDSVGGNRRVSVEGDRRVSIGGSHKDKVDKKRFLRVEGDREVHIRGIVHKVVHKAVLEVIEGGLQERIRGEVVKYLESNLIRVVKGNRYRKVEGKTLMDFRGPVHRKYGSWKLECKGGVLFEAAKGITVKCGSTILTVDEKRSVLKASEFTVNDGAPEFSAKDVDLKEPAAPVYGKLRCTALESTPAEQKSLGDEVVFRLSEVEELKDDGSRDGEWESKAPSGIESYLLPLIRWQYVYSNDREPNGDTVWQDVDKDVLDEKGQELKLTPSEDNLSKFLHVKSYVADASREAGVSVALKRAVKITGLRGIHRINGGESETFTALFNIDDPTEEELESLTWEWQGVVDGEKSTEEPENSAQQPEITLKVPEKAEGESVLTATLDGESVELQLEHQSNGNKPVISNGNVLMNNTIYTVVSGDTLAKIAKHHNVTEEQIYGVNDNIDRSNRDRIFIGQKINIPVESTEGDSTNTVLFEIELHEEDRSSKTISASDYKNIRWAGMVVESKEGKNPTDRNILIDKLKSLSEDDITRVKSLSGETASCPIEGATVYTSTRKEDVDTANVDTKEELWVKIEGLLWKLEKFFHGKGDVVSMGFLQLSFDKLREYPFYQGGKRHVLLVQPFLLEEDPCRFDVWRVDEGSLVDRDMIVTPEDVGVNDTWDPVTNDRISKLHPDVQRTAVNFINQVESELNIKLRVVQGLRTFKEQDDLYAQGRTTEGPIVTNAKGGKSYHNYGLAIDVVEIRNGKTIWNTDWPAISKIGIRNGFEWGGNFKSISDKPHFQMTFGYLVSDLRKLYDSGEWYEKTD